jgi:hypothetical protein
VAGGARWAGPVRAYALTVTAAAYLGLCKAWLDRFRARGTPEAESGRGSLALATTVAAVALLPLVVLMKDDQHPYQFYKLLESVGPLLVLGLFLLGQRPVLEASASGPPGWRGRLLPPAGAVCFGAVCALTAIGAGRTVRATCRYEPGERCWSAYVMHEPDVRAAQHQLSQGPPGRLVLALCHPGMETAYLNAWFSWFGRGHQIHLLGPYFWDLGPESPAWQKALAPTALPADASILLRKGPSPVLPVGEFTPVWSAGKFRLIKPAGNGGWALVYHLTGPTGPEGEGDGALFWIGKGVTSWEVSACRPGALVLRAGGLSGPRRFRVRTSAGHQAAVVLKGGANELAVPVPAGPCTVTLEPLEPPGRSPLVGVSGLDFRCAPATVASVKTEGPRPAE